MTQQQTQGGRVWTLLIGPGGTGVFRGMHPGHEGVERVIVSETRAYEEPISALAQEHREETQHRSGRG